ncbi:TetR family transcriptional regulator [Amycolatopsis pithecellobii]|uniref:TetR family transcriptional regulator n=1 Tax=Amycolatopsis pithecellobii TaxID=664692 RepID=A0A6N7Z5W0_9PSEU|nr:TetR family transcriptional regulator [Amycolatopsis pithecellobii]MTD56020.1 TetR family transcriptional regulator [Amycolatopsis pithecellobii]
MAWDTEETRRRLMEAAIAEFGERGPEATMADIAKRAGINKERLYNYFGDKQALFDTVLSNQLKELAAAVGRPDGDVADIGEFAGRTFDYHQDHPNLVRLLLWEALAQRPADNPERSAHYRDKVERYANAQRDDVLDDEIDADYALFMLIALAAWWVAVPQLARMLTGASADNPAERARRRAAVVRAAERIALPRTNPTVAD